MKTELLIEQLNPTESNLIVEGAGAGKDLFLSGIYMQSEVENRNGRRYPLAEITEAVANANIRIKESNGIFGELDHPQSLNINLDRISHVITEMKMVGNDAIGKAKIIPTPMGQIARTLIESGAKVGVSSRGAGQVNESVVSGFSFVTVDLVAQPSAPGAVPDSIYESLMNNSHGKEAVSLTEQVRHDPKAQAFLQKEILKFLSDLNWKKR